MTYQQLIDFLSQQSKESLQQDVTVFVNGEYFPIYNVLFDDSDVLDKDHIVIDLTGELSHKTNYEETD